MLVQVIMTDGSGDIIGKRLLVSDLAKIYSKKNNTVLSCAAYDRKLCVTCWHPGRIKPHLSIAHLIWALDLTQTNKRT